MLNSYIHFMQLVSEAGEVKGRKKLQKMVYIAQKLGLPFDERFSFHMYGPYSEELTIKIQELCNIGFILESEIKKNGALQYTYGIADKGHSFLTSCNSKANLNKMVLQSLQTESSRFLELVATIMYFDDLEKQEIINKVQKIKASQNYTVEEFERGFNYIKSLQALV